MVPCVELWGPAPWAGLLLQARRGKRGVRRLWGESLAAHTSHVPWSRTQEPATWPVLPGLAFHLQLPVVRLVPRPLVRPAPALPCGTQPPFFPATLPRFSSSICLVKVGFPRVCPLSSSLLIIGGAVSVTEPHFAEAHNSPMKYALVSSSSYAWEPRGQKNLAGGHAVGSGSPGPGPSTHICPPLLIPLAHLGTDFSKLFFPAPGPTAS